MRIPQLLPDNDRPRVFVKQENGSLPLARFESNHIPGRGGIGLDATA